jgi:hypothetical protein
LQKNYFFSLSDQAISKECLMVEKNSHHSCALLKQTVPQKDREKIGAEHVKQCMSLLLLTTKYDVKQLS